MTEVEKKEQIRQALVRRYGSRVLSGPFSGMTYLARAAGSELLPKLLGTYELELHLVLERLLRASWERVVNIGCGEGYYAVGLAFRLPDAAIHAFDSDEEACQLCSELAALNSVPHRLHLGGACAPSHLAPVAGRSTLILCDCEGAEGDLLRPGEVPGLARCTVVVELHEFLRPGVTRELAGRFAPTHALAYIPAVERAPGLVDQALALAELPPTAQPSDGRLQSQWREPDEAQSSLSGEERWLALSECRPPGMGWLFMTPRHAA